MSNSPVYQDYGNREVEKMARAVCAMYGQDPDDLTPETGYSDACLVPKWWKHQEFAMMFIACRDLPDRTP